MQASDTEKIEVSFENQNEDRTSTFELKLIDLEMDHLGIPEQEYGCTITMSSNEFARVCRDLGSMGDSLTISCSKMSVQFKVKGDMGNGSMVYRKEINDGQKGIEIEMEEEVEQHYAMRYLTSFSKSNVLSERVS